MRKRIDATTFDNELIIIIIITNMITIIKAGIALLMTTGITILTNIIIIIIRDR